MINTYLFILVYGKAKNSLKTVIKYLELILK